jgi:Mrp family chromosome partitioning ATPase
MSKVLETLRQTALTPPAPDAPPPAGESGPADEETPFIEVGPLRSFQASASVLATMPAPRPSAPPAPPVSLPRPHNVLFRSLTPPSRFAPELVAFHAPAEADSLRYSDLLRSVISAAAAKAGKADHGASALLFLGARPEAGTTTALLNLAITAARQGGGVVVVDANLRRPGVADRLGLSPAPGLAEVLGGECELADALRPTEQPNLVALTAGAPAPTLASTEALRALLQELHTRYELVVVDGPHWDGRAGVKALASVCGAAFLVVRRGEADAPPASDLVRALPEQGVALAGCVLTGE